MRVKPIGIIHTPHRQSLGTPIQPRAAEGVKGWVEIFEEFLPGLQDLKGFERIWLVYWFDRAPSRSLRLLVTPYLDKTPRGLFSTRAPARPNRIGMSPVRLLSVRGNRLAVQDVDILDGTPLLDIKPYVPQFDCYPHSQSGWVGAANPRKVLADNRFARPARRGLRPR